MFLSSRNTKLHQGTSLDVSAWHQSRKLSKQAKKEQLGYKIRLLQREMGQEIETDLADPQVEQPPNAIWELVLICTE